jgi:hypothetical protein
MGAVFAFAAGTDDITAATPAAVATGMRITFAVAAALILLGARHRGRRPRARGSSTDGRPLTRTALASTWNW